MTAEQLIEVLGLEPLPDEGGYYRETYRSPEILPSEILPARYTADKNCATAIYYLLTPETCSRLHRLPADEVYHFYSGDPVTLLQLHTDGTGSIATLGPNLAAGHLVQTVVRHDTWQGSFLNDGGHYALMGTTMAPGFDFSDFEPGNAETLISEYAEYAALIRRLSAA